MATESKTILVIEDERTLREPLAAKLTAEGFTVLEASNGQEGLDMALRQHPDLLILDVVMPVMDGWTMLDALHQDAWGKTAQVIMLTNLDDPQTVLKSLHNGAPNVLVKVDWTITDLVEEIRQKLV